MNFNQIMNKTTFLLKKHSPEILLVSGIAGVVTSAIMACRASTKVEEILERSTDRLNKVKSMDISEEYTEKDSKKDTTLIYVQTGLEFVKLYGPSVLLGATSIACILASHGVLKKRNAALAAAYTAIDKSFKDYRERVVERFGKDVDEQLKLGLKADEIEVTTINGKGKEKTTKETVYISDGKASGYVKYFTKGNPCWDNDPNRRKMYFKSIQSYSNDKLRACGHLTLNEVYRELGFNDTKAGMVVGWIFDKANNAIGDNYVEFDIKEVQIPNEYGLLETAYAIDFNVDGDIYSRL